MKTTYSPPPSAHAPKLRHAPPVERARVDAGSVPNPLVYWLSTTLLALWMTISALGFFTGQPAFAGALARLDFPGYFPALLGTAKLLAVGGLVLPGLDRLREWAYAGLTFIFLGAVWSHLAADEPVRILAPLAALALALLSYATLPLSRSVPRPLS